MPPASSAPGWSRDSETPTYMELAFDRVVLVAEDVIRACVGGSVASIRLYEDVEDFLASDVATCKVLIGAFPASNGGTFVVGDLEAKAPARHSPAGAASGPSSIRCPAVLHPGR